MMCKNLFSYPDGTVFTGYEILDFIAYHTNTFTGKTKYALYMKKKFGNIKPECSYKFFKQWYGCTGTVNKPRLLRVDHKSRVFREYEHCGYGDCFEVCYEGTVCKSFVKVHCI